MASHCACLARGRRRCHLLPHGPAAVQQVQAPVRSASTRSAVGAPSSRRTRYSWPARSLLYNNCDTDVLERCGFIYDWTHVWSEVTFGGEWSRRAMVIAGECILSIHIGWISKHRLRTLPHFNIGALSVFTTTLHCYFQCSQGPALQMQVHCPHSQKPCTVTFNAAKSLHFKCKCSH